MHPGITSLFLLMSFSSDKNCQSIICLQDQPFFSNSLPSYWGYMSFSLTSPTYHPKVALYAFASLINITTIAHIFSVRLDLATLGMSAIFHFSTCTEIFHISNDNWTRGDSIMERTVFLTEAPAITLGPTFLVKNFNIHHPPRAAYPHWCYTFTALQDSFPYFSRTLKHG